MKLNLRQLTGEIPRLLPRLLPDMGSQRAENVRLDDGGLTPVRKSKLVTTLGISNAQTIYKFGATWLAWPYPVNAVPGPVATDRLYYTGDGVPKMRVGSTVYNLKLVAPTTKLTASLTGTGTGDVTTRLYVYTFVTSFGEESEPCPISDDVLWQSGRTVTLSGFQAGDATRGVVTQRLYRSQSSSQSGTDLFLIDERAASTSNWVDTKGPTQFSEPLPSKDYNNPPDDLSGLIALPNGMMAGFSGKQLCFCEPYKPHAWPIKYRLTAAFNIVALGAYANTVVAGTAGTPYIVTGTHPDNMVEEKTELNLPCLNARGIVDLGYTVAYPSTDGLVVVGSGGANIATRETFTRQDWQKLAPATLVAGQFAGRYFASFQYVEIDGSVSSGVRIIDLSGEQPFVLRSNINPAGFYYDQPTGALYFTDGANVYEWDALGQSNEVMTWESKDFVLPMPVSFGALLVEGVTVYSAEQQKAQADAIAAINAANAAVFAADMNAEIDGHEFNGFALNDDAMQSAPALKYIQVDIYADNHLIRSVSTIDEVKRIPPVKAKNWKIKVTGTAEIEQITMATTARELNEV